MTRTQPTPTLYDLAYDILTRTPRRRPDGQPVNVDAWTRAVAAAIEAAAAEAGTVRVRPNAADPAPTRRARPADTHDLDLCAHALGVNLALILSRDMDEEAAEARHIVAYVLREATPSSLAAVGRLLGRYHGTVRHSCEVVSRRVGRDARVRARVEACMSAVLCAPDGQARGAVA